MTITIYYYELWAASQAARMACHEIKAKDPAFAFKEERVDMEKGDHRRPPFKSLAPHNEPPVLVDDSGAHSHAQTNWDTVGIARYLEVKSPGVFIPPLPCGLQLSYQWIGWAHTFLAEPMNRIVRECLANPPGNRNVTLLGNAYQRLHRLAQDVDDNVIANGGGFINWDKAHQPADAGSYSFADMYIISALQLASHIPANHFSLAQFKNANDYYNLVKNQGSFQSVWGAFQFPPTVGHLGP